MTIEEADGIAEMIGASNGRLTTGEREIYRERLKNIGHALGKAAVMSLIDAPPERGIRPHHVFAQIRRLTYQPEEGKDCERCQGTGFVAGRPHENIGMVYETVKPCGCRPIPKLKHARWESW